MITFPSSLGAPLLNPEAIYPCTDAGKTQNPLPGCTVLFPGLPVPSLEPYDLLCGWWGIPGSNLPGILALLQEPNTESSQPQSRPQGISFPDSI